MALTMDQLNAVYNDMSVYGDTYKNSVAPTAVNTIPSIPDVAPINNIPVLPMQYINQGGDNDGGITSIAPDYGYESSYAGTGTTPGENENYLKDIGEGTIDQADIKNNRMGIMELIQKGITGYMKYGPIGQVKRGINFVKQKKEERAIQKEIELQEEIARENEAAANRARVEAYTGQPMSDYRQSRARSEQNYTGGDTNSNPSTPGAQDSFSNKSGMGRTGYGKGGIVSL